MIAQTRIPGEVTVARERVETAWFGRMERDDALAALVTADDTRREPLHRWAVFKQAFSPKLVRRFLDETQAPGPSGGPLLDPFSGTGTFVVECARCGVAAVGVDSLLSLAFVTQAKWGGELPDAPDLSGCETWFDIADRLSHPVHRAALICAAAACTTAKGTLNKNAPPPGDVFRERLAVIRDDLRKPPPRANLVVCGDARDLSFVANASIGGVLTSPPYLSRHDYARLARPFESVFDRWFVRPPLDQLPASPRAGAAQSASRRSPRTPADLRLPDAVAEAFDTLRGIGQAKLAHVVRAYFRDMARVLRTCRRVLQPGAPCWIVVGGARLKDVYIPSDTILADYARSIGFAVERIRVARTLVPGARKFGRLANVAPRESLLVMERDEQNAA